MDAIYTRRSIRKFTSKPVSNELIESLIKAGMNAIGKRPQPWQFIILTDRTMFPEIIKIHPYTDMLTTAPAAILVCGEFDLGTNKGYWMIGCRLPRRTLSLVIAVARTGGSLVRCVSTREAPVEGIRKLLRLPEHVVPFCSFRLATPTETKPPKNLFRPERIHRNGW